jgi:hypothetical protein
MKYLYPEVQTVPGDVKVSNTPTDACRGNE